MSLPRIVRGGRVRTGDLLALSQPRCHCVTPQIDNIWLVRYYGQAAAVRFSSGRPTTTCVRIVIDILQLERYYVNGIGSIGLTKRDFSVGGCS